MGWLVLVAAAQGADKPDPALLEFLGSVDTGDKAWHDYLAHTDIEQVAKRAAAARVSPVPVSATQPTPVSDPAQRTQPPPPPPAPPPANPAPVSHP